MSRMPTTAQTWKAGAGVSGILSEAAGSCPDSIYLEDRFGSVYTYAETEESVCRLARFLSEKGVKRGDRVAIHLQNCSEIAIALYAVARIGGTYVILNANLKPKGVQKILSQAEPEAIVSDSQTLPSLEGWSPPRIGVILGDEVPGESWATWDSAMETKSEINPWDFCQVDVASLVFTSGSTGVPRGVALSHENICFVVGAIQERLCYRPSDTVGCFLPLAFDYGLYQIFLAAQAGAKLFIGDPGQVGPRLPAILKEAKISILPGVPSVYAALIALGKRRPFELPLLRAITNTGERLPESYILRMQEMFPGIDVYVMYGLTECKRVSIMLPSELKTHPHAVGRALSGTEVYAADGDGKRLEPGEEGELVVRGRHVALGYWRAWEETLKRYRKRSSEGAVELFTGDTGRVDGDGFIYFASRSDDMIKHRGNRISPLEIEIEACSISGVIEASLLPRELDDTLHLFLTVSDATCDKAFVLNQLGNVLESAKIPAFVEILQEMPKSMNGKIDRKGLRAKLEGGE